MKVSISLAASFLLAMLPLSKASEATWPVVLQKQSIPGLSDCQVQLLTLSSRASDLEFQMQLLTQRQIRLAYIRIALFNNLSSLSPSSSRYHVIQRQIAEVRRQMAPLMNQREQLRVQTSDVRAQMNALSCR
ncbi:hypothetical protein DXZ20_18040 [Leptolyngbyaceae cyanobacterium CCMR0081]|uniref:Uncharacterized protein n=1 Tax=Adonisia turfae CCMR0081 TaxID=2292702 RepID=A0A6M0RMT0_9CYAN|nr:hypothetical protein [Adonisia turfae CCMR0081]